MLFRSGLGSPLPGIWVTPDVTKEKEVAAAVEALGVEGYSFTGPFGEVGDQQRVVAQAWQLDDVQQRYAEFLEAFTSGRIGTPAEAYRSQVRLVQEWRRFPFLDPGLPAELLPSTWPGPAAADLFHRRHDRWHAAAQAYWLDLLAAAERRV